MRDRLATLLESELDVLVAYLFGSHARGVAKDGSDVDVAFLLDEASDHSDRQLELLADIQGAAAPARADLLLLNEAPAAVGYRVLRDGILLVCRDPVAQVRHFVKTVNEYLDMAPMRRMIEDGQRRRLAGGRFGRP